MSRRSLTKPRRSIPTDGRDTHTHTKHTHTHRYHASRFAVSCASDFIDLIRDADAVTVSAVFYNASHTAPHPHSHPYRCGCGADRSAPRSRGGERTARFLARASIQSPYHNNAVVDVWRSAHGINIGSKYVIPADIAGGHLICSLYIIPRYGTSGCTASPLLRSLPFPTSLPPSEPPTTDRVRVTVARAASS